LLPSLPLHCSLLPPPPPGSSSSESSVAWRKPCEKGTNNHQKCFTLWYCHRCLPLHYTSHMLIHASTSQLYNKHYLQTKLLLYY
jgi:hypothetical protein